MKQFCYGHATHPDWRMATELVLAQIEGQRADPSFESQASLGMVYATAALAEHLDAIREMLTQRTGVSEFVGAVGQAVCAGTAEYTDEPALAVMLAALPEDSFRIFSGRRRPPGLSERNASGALCAHVGLVHADPGAQDLPGMVRDMALRTVTGYLLGGIVSGDLANPPQLAGEVIEGGLSGVMFSEQVRLLTRVTQGCTPLAGEHVISQCRSHYIQMLDGRPALDVMLDDLGVKETARQSRDGDAILRALPMERLKRGLFVGLAGADADRGIGFGDYQVRNVVGIDPQNRLLAVAGEPQQGDRAVFCTRDQQAARADLVRICTELRDELESESLSARGALYFSCVARGRHLFGSSGAELELIRHNLGEIPLVGFFANGEIARDRIYGYTGVLAVFV